MIRTRTIGACLIAMFAMSAFGTASASAFTLLLSHPAPQLVLAVQIGKHVFTVEGKKVECNIAHFHALVTILNSSLVLIKPIYSECTAFGFVNSTVHVNSCHYTLHIDGKTDIGCPAGREIEILVNNGSSCTIKVKPQTGLQLVTFANVKGANGRMGVETKIAIKKIALTSNGKGIGCPAASATEGEYTGNSIAEGALGDLLVS